MADHPDSELRWLTYEEAAELLGVKADSVRRRASSKKWPRRLGNDGLSRVGIPTSIIPDRDPDPAPDILPALPPENPDLLALRADLTAVRAEAMELRGQLAEARERAASLEGEAGGLRDRLADAHAERDRLAGLLEKALQPKPSIWTRLWGR